MKRVAQESKRINWIPAKRNTVVPGATAWQGTNGLYALVAKEAGRWHVSVSAKGRYPTWDEMASAREKFTPDSVTMAMILPPRSEYVNLHQTTLHLHELVDGEVAS